MIVGADDFDDEPAHGEVTAAPEPPAFQTGGQLSVPVLKEIAATLHQMDARLARLETAPRRCKCNAAADSRGRAQATDDELETGSDWKIADSLWGRHRDAR